MISSRILARIRESMMGPETSTTSVALMVPEGYSGRAGRSRVWRWADGDPGDRRLVDADGGDGLETLLAVVPQGPDHHLDGPGGGGGQQGADEAGEFDAGRRREEHEPRA